MTSAADAYDLVTALFPRRRSGRARAALTARALDLYREGNDGSHRR
jgi:hypothetical protein